MQIFFIRKRTAVMDIVMKVPWSKWNQTGDVPTMYITLEDSCQHHAKLLGKLWTRIADNARNQEVTSFYPCTYRYWESTMDESGLVKSRFLPVWMLFFLDFGTKTA